MKECFYENMPSMANPLGLGHKAMPLACKVQNLLIADSCITSPCGMMRTSPLRAAT